MTASALRQEEHPSPAEIIAALETADRRPDEALRAGMIHAAEIAPAVIALLEEATSGEKLLQPQENLLFWGIHVLGAAHRTELYRPLLKFLRACTDDDLDQLLGDATTETMTKIVISVFDGDALPLLDACSDRNVNGYVRWDFIDALARLTFDGAIARETTLAFLDRFEREPLADPDDDAWQGWQDAIYLLGLEEMRERLRAAHREGRFFQDNRELEYCLKQLTVAQNLASGDDALFVRTHLVPINDPVAALQWVSSEQNGVEVEDQGGFEGDLEDDGSVAPDPAVAIALNQEECDWLRQFIASRPAAVEVMSLESIDGYYCALAMAADWDRARSWATEIFGAFDDKLAFDDDEQARRAAELLSRLLKSIATRLDSGFAHDPLLENSTAPKAQLWAKGFISGMQVAVTEWKDYIASDEVREFLGPILALALNEYEEQEGMRMTPELRADCVPLLPSVLLGLYSSVRLEAETVQKPARSTKIGRNQPCPCGSGKKYKRCCGAPENSFT